MAGPAISQTTAYTKLTLPNGSPDGSKLACWGQTREIRLWDVKTGHQIHQRPEVRKILDEEILTLPERLRTPLLLCCLEGRTKAEAAKQLGWKEGTVASRLARARKRLQGRLTRRGITLAAGPVSLLLAEEASAAVPVAIAASTVRLAVLFAAGEALAGNVPTTVAFLTKGILNTMALSKLKAGAALVVTACVLFTGAGWAAHQVLANKPAEEQRKDQQRSRRQQRPMKPSWRRRISTVIRCRLACWLGWAACNFAIHMLRWCFLRIVRPLFPQARIRESGSGMSPLASSPEVSKLGILRMPRHFVSIQRFPPTVRFWPLEITNVFVYTTQQQERNCKSSRLKRLIAWALPFPRMRGFWPW